MQTFNFPYHRSELRYPEDSAVVRFGKGYEFASRPDAPPQLRFLLHFPTMKFFVTAGGAIDRTTQPQINLAKLMDFYEAHRLYEKFIYPSPIKGNVVVRFATPLDIVPLAGGGGACEPFTLELTGQP